MNGLARTVLGSLAAVAVAAGAMAPAHADGSGSIDHIQSQGSKVQMLFAVPDGVSPDLDSVSVKVGDKPVDASATPVKAGEIERTSVLALDVSNSMQGDRFEAAKEAALAYLSGAPDDVAIGLVTFAGAVTVVDSPTTDHAALADAVEGLELAIGTSLYDAVLESLVQAGSEGQRDVIVLSDGADTTTTPLADVVSSAKSSGVNVNVVALEQSAADRAQLEKITEASDGAVLPADDPQALAAVFQREADALAQQVLIEFVAPTSGDTTVSASLDAEGQTYTDSTFTTLVGRSAAPSNGNPIPVDTPSRMLDDQFLFGGLGALGIGLAAILAVLLAGKPRRRQETLVERQLDFYSTGSHAAGRHHAKAAKPQVNVRDSAVAVADQIVQKAGFEERLNQRLTSAGISLTTAEWLLLHAGCAVGGALLGFLLGGPVKLLIFLALGVVGPWLFLKFKASRRIKAFGTQLADTLQLMSGGLSAGLSLPQSVDTVVREGAEPMASELRRALIEQRLGVDIEDALDGVSERMESKDFAWVVMAIRIQREVGGNLAELLNTVAGTIREREYLRRQVKTLSAEGRMSAWILGGLPVAFTLYLASTKPDYLSTMYTTPIGWMMSIAACVMMTLGMVVMKAVVKVEV